MKTHRHVSSQPCTEYSDCPGCKRILSPKPTISNSFGRGEWTVTPPVIDGNYLARFQGKFCILGVTLQRDDEAKLRWRGIYQFFGRNLSRQVFEEDISLWWSRPLPPIPKGK